MQSHQSDNMSEKTTTANGCSNNGGDNSSAKQQSSQPQDATSGGGGSAGDSCSGGGGSNSRASSSTSTNLLEVNGKPKGLNDSLQQQFCRFADYFVICGLDLASGLEMDLFAGKMVYTNILF